MLFNRGARLVSNVCIVWGLLVCACSAAESEPASLSARTDGDVDRMEQAGRYLDLRNYIEHRLADGVQPTATPLAYLCLAYGKLKQYSQLFDCMSKLEQRVQQGDTNIQALNSLRYNAVGDARPLLGAIRAEAMLEFGEYGKAIAIGEKALAAVPKSSFSYSPPFPPVKLKLTILPILVISAAQAGDLEQAGRFMGLLEAVEMPFGGSGMWETLRSNGLGRAYMALGAYDKVLSELGGLRRSTVTGGFADLVRGWGAKGDSFVTIYELPRRVMLGKALAETGKTTDAKSSLDEVLASARIKDMGDLYWLALYERGRIAEAEKDLLTATKLYQGAVEVIEEQRSTINTEASKIGFVGDKQAVYARLVSVLVEQKRVADAFDYVERSKSRALVDMLASKKDFSVQGAEPQKAREALTQLDAAELGSHVQDEVDKTSSSGVRNLKLVRQQIKTTAPELASLVGVSAVPSEELETLIGQDEALVEYYAQGKDLYVFILTREQLQVQRLNSAGLDARVRELRSALEQLGSDAWRSPAKALYEQLWQPFDAALTGKSVVVVAHGVLHYLPFAALPRPEGDFLIDHYGLRFLPSASVLKFLRPAGQSGRAQMLALGNPDLGDPKLDLQFAEGEARAVGGLFRDSRVLVRKDASETNFKKEGQRFSRIHFAMHGKFQAEDPLASGLYLAKDAENDGVLTVGELYTLNLDADLVTLSACETGLGKVANGDDVVGLTRGFLYAGSRSIVASLWSVDDNATAELMKDFYRNLASQNKDESLRRAQISTRKGFPHPFYWAAFQLTGRSE